MVLEDFHTRNNVSENIPQFGHAPSELFGTPVQGRKSLKNVGLMAPNYSSAGASLIVRRRLVSVYRRFGTAKGELLDPWNVGTDELLHKSVTNYQPTSCSVPENRYQIAVIFDNISTAQVPNKFPVFFHNSPLLNPLLTHKSNPFPHILFL